MAHSLLRIRARPRPRRSRFLSFVTTVAVFVGVTAGAAATGLSSGVASGSAVGSTESTARSVVVAASLPGALVPVAAVRELDTRTTHRSIPAGGVLVVMLAVPGVPASQVAAVSLNVTVGSGRSAGYLAIYPHGSTWANTSNLNFGARKTVANAASTPLGAASSVDVRNGSAAPVDVILDVEGYVVAGSTTRPGSVLISTARRILDGRSRSGIAADASLAVRLGSSLPRQFASLVRTAGYTMDR